MRVLTAAVFVASSLLPPLVPRASAQSVAVEVTAAESGARLVGAFLSLLDDDERVLRNALAGPAGRFSFHRARCGWRRA